MTTTVWFGKPTSLNPLLLGRCSPVEQDAKDVIQEALLNAYLHLDQFERRADLRTWLNRILVNCALDHLRARRRRPDVSEPPPILDVAETIAAQSMRLSTSSG